MLFFEWFVEGVKGLSLKTETKRKRWKLYFTYNGTAKNPNEVMKNLESIKGNNIPIGGEFGKRQLK